VTLTSPYHLSGGGAKSANQIAFEREIDKLVQDFDRFVVPVNDFVVALDFYAQVFGGKSISALTLEAVPLNPHIVFRFALRFVFDSWYAAPFSRHPEFCQAAEDTAKDA